MKYKASLYATGYFGHLLTALFLLMLCGFIYTREYLASTTLVAAAAITTIRLYRRGISFDSHVVRYDGWFRTVVIPYSEILKVENSGAIGYPSDRRHGSLEYRITTKRKRWWISLLWFNSDAAKEFTERIAERNQDK